jgi:hypothetical protein
MHRWSTRWFAVINSYTCIVRTVGSPLETTLFCQYWGTVRNNAKSIVWRPDPFSYQIEVKLIGNNSAALMWPSHSVSILAARRSTALRDRCLRISLIIWQTIPARLAAFHCTFECCCSESDNCRCLRMQQSCGPSWLRRESRCSLKPFRVRLQLCTLDFEIVALLVVTVHAKERRREEDHGLERWRPILMSSEMRLLNFCIEFSLDGTNSTQCTFGRFASRPAVPGTATGSTMYYR